MDGIPATTGGGQLNGHSWHCCSPIMASKCTRGACKPLDFQRRVLVGGCFLLLERNLEWDSGELLCMYNRGDPYSPLSMSEMWMSMLQVQREPLDGHSMA
jgi:hypothetical protein